MDMHIGRCGPVHARVRAPPSKSFTHRALIIAALAEGVSLIKGQLDADDTRITARALAALGVRIVWEHGLITVYGTGGMLQAPGSAIDIGDSGTSMRLLTAVCLLADGPVTMTGSARMQERPIGPLVDALNNAGASISYLQTQGCPPLIIDGTLEGGDIQADGSISSQFISSLLIASPYAEKDATISLVGPVVSEPYIRITTGMMSLFGVTPDLIGHSPLSWKIHAGMGYKPVSYTVEGDYSSSSYWFALAAVTRGSVTVEGLTQESDQGDRRLLDILKQMGCTITWNHDGETGDTMVMVSCNGPLSGVDVDMADCPDVVQTLAVVAAVAETPTRITGIHHLRAKESDRIAAIVKGLKELGIRCEADDDEIVISPGKLTGGIIHPERDHRTAMSFAILGTAIGNVTILDAGCVTKSYPDFWEEFRSVWKTAGSC
ncbi:3-phosphoshikimate 1-carboxyvinyltransferase [uncultured Methanospirillum sp.]|uniref:3-phosphoshikimate 1-carboxyvinyltransferase n=1 Tax=uncultured Methanospirillum sp. TaxID=262503 RepID=UPI0029C8E360|nr:3-phosphoshikimate 1-carboxyvinyltransferase [uncultured Methanospirillum sp.]